MHTSTYSHTIHILATFRTFSILYSYTYKYTYARHSRRTNECRFVATHETTHRLLCIHLGSHLLRPTRRWRLIRSLLMASEVMYMHLALHDRQSAKRWSKRLGVASSHKGETSRQRRVAQSK